MPNAGELGGLVKLMALLGVAGLLAYGITGGASPPPQAASPAATVQARSPLSEPGDLVRIKSQNWHTGGFDTVAIANLTLENDNPYAVKDIHLACRYYAPSGTLLTVARPVLYDTIPAKGLKSIRNFSVGFVHSQAHKGGCEVTSASLN